MTAPEPTPRTAAGRALADLLAQPGDPLFWPEICAIEAEAAALAEPTSLTLVAPQGSTLTLAPLPTALATPTQHYHDFENALCPNCVTPWKCNGPHLSDQVLCSCGIAAAYQQEPQP